MSSSLVDQVAVVVGGGSGLGLALVERFREEGAQVAVLEKSAEKAAALRAGLPDVVVVEGDATQYDAVASTMSAAQDAWGRVDSVVANVGIWDFGAELVEISPDALAEAFREVFEVNVLSALTTAAAAAAELRRTRGSLILTLSNAAFSPGGGGVLYTASKHALVGVVRQLAHEFAPDIRVNGVAPGGMRTDLRGPRSLGMAARSFSGPEVDSMMREWSPLGIAPVPSDYAGHFVLLASRRDGTTATGAIHVCDGGSAVRG